MERREFNKEIVQMVSTGYPAMQISEKESIDGFKQGVLDGLSQKQKTLPPSGFYDERGSKLFEKITTLTEYYLTRCEREIIEQNLVGICALLPKTFRIVELGAGDGHKTKILLKYLLQHERKFAFEYVAVDISSESNAELKRSLATELPTLLVSSSVTEYFKALEDLHQQNDLPLVVLFLGSSIGNLEDRGVSFLDSLHKALKPGDVAIIGFDQDKTETILLPAYSDSQGVTKEFNLNYLKRINEELKGNFNPYQFLHEASYNPSMQRMESHLRSMSDQTVEVVGHTFFIRKYERIFMEISCKYTPGEIKRLAHQSGFTMRQAFYDEFKYFMLAILQA